MATQDEIVAFLSKVPLFHDLKDVQLRRLAKHMRERSYGADELILEQGKQGVGLFVIVEGGVKVVRTQIDGTVFELDRLGRTDFFGELSLLDDAPRSASVITVTATQCLALEKLLFLDEISSDPEMAIAMLKTLAARYRRLIQNM